MYTCQPRSRHAAVLELLKYYVLKSFVSAAAQGRDVISKSLKLIVGLA
jgi:hypothetical protein